MSENVSAEQELSVKQQQIITRLVSGMSIDAASKSIAIADKTVHRWMKQPAFSQALKAAQQELYDASLRKLQSLQTDVLAALEKHLRADVEPSAGTQMKAATFLYSQAVQTQQVADLAAQVAELKSMIITMQERNKS